MEKLSFSKKRSSRKCGRFAQKGSKCQASVKQVQIYVMEQVNDEKFSKEFIFAMFTHIQWEIYQVYLSIYLSIVTVHYKFVQKKENAKKNVWYRIKNLSNESRNRYSSIVVCDTVQNLQRIGIEEKKSKHAYTHTHKMIATLCLHFILRSFTPHVTYYFWPWYCNVSLSLSLSFCCCRRCRQIN